jgi:hypothetical protein
MLINCGLYNVEDIYIFKEGMIPQEPRAKTSGEKRKLQGTWSAYDFRDFERQTL